jgi:hypothetical protein
VKGSALNIGLVGVDILSDHLLHRGKLDDSGLFFASFEPSSQTFMVTSIEDLISDCFEWQ